MHSIRRMMFGLLLLWLATAAVPARCATRYVCPPCAQSCDTLAFDHPGACPLCGMALVEAASVAAVPQKERSRVAILIFNGVEIIDSMGPYEVFGAAGFDVYTVGATKNAVTSAMGQVMTPQFTLAEAPQPDVLVVPGGGIGSALNDSTTLAWVRTTSEKTRHTMSVCNGAFILASSGLLDGLAATTTAHNIPKLRAQYPKVHVVENQRYVDNGHIITTGGLSAGIDGALHVVERMRGLGEAQEVALSEEYPWSPRSSFARASLADQLIPDVPMDSLGRWTVVRTEGDAARWNLELEGTSDLSAGTLLDRLGQELRARGQWVVAAAKPGAADTRAVRFKGREGEPWSGTMTVAPRTAGSHAYTVRLRIARQG
jgi:putative intracellular protease/amidase